MASEVGMIGLFQPTHHPQCQDGQRCNPWLDTFLYCVVIPVAVLFTFILVMIVWVLCRTPRKCKNYSSLPRSNSDIQLEDYNTIRRASLCLRQMSHNRETPILASRAGSTVTLDRPHRQNRRARDVCNSAPGTLQRQNRNRQSIANEERPLPPSYQTGNHQSLQLTEDLHRRLDDSNHSLNLDGQNKVQARLYRY